MKRMSPTSWFWIVAAAVLAVALFTTGHVHGQSTGAKATFEGRPAMAGAQAGTGAMAGPPQGGVGPQSPEDPASGLGARRQAQLPGDATAGPVLPRDSGVDRGSSGPVLPRDPGMDRPANEGLQPKRDRDPGNVVKRDRGGEGIGDSGKATGKAKRAGQRSIERARRGVSGVDS